MALDIVTATFSGDSYFTQTVSTGTTAVGRVVSYDQNTGVLKFWQDRSLAGFTHCGIGQHKSNTYGFDLTENLLAVPGTGGSSDNYLQQQGCRSSIDTAFSGITTVINNRTYYLGQILLVVLLQSRS